MTGAAGEALMPAEEGVSENIRPDGIAFELRVLGPFALIERASGATIPVTAAKMRAMLAFLAASPGFSESRRRIAGLLWAGGAEDQARHSLRQLLSQFKRTGQGRTVALLDYDDETIAFNTGGVTADYAILAQARKSKDMAVLRAAAGAYRGDFGSELETGLSEFDLWLTAERTRCRDAAIVILDRLIRLLAAAGQHREALERANRLLEIEPFREETQRLVLTQENMVSGRASALARFQSFKELLRKELDVAPEQATIEIVENIRSMADRRPAPPEPEPAPAEDLRPPEADIVPVTAVPKTGHRRAFMAAGLAVLLFACGVPTWQMLRAPVAYVGESPGRASVAILPFQLGQGVYNMQTHAQSLETDTRLAFSHSMRLTPVEIREETGPRDAIGIGRALGARYVVKTTFSQAGDQILADIALFDTASGVSLAAAAIPTDGMSIRFAREFYRFVYPEIILDRAKTLAAKDPDSISALLWRAEAARIHTRVGAADPSEFTFYEAALAREPDQFFALLGLANCLILKVAREQSSNRAEDIARASELLRRAREQAPNLAEIAFQEGMLNKLQGKFEAAGLDFERAFRTDRTHWNAAAQAAHVKIFVGRFEDAYREMEAATAYLLPDIAAAETAYVAGETALVAGHPDRAVTYLDMAIVGNATVPRIHGMRAAALSMAGREKEARAAAAQSQKLKPVYTPELMAQRGRTTATPRFKEARDRYVAAYRAALTPAPASTN
jgi:DNA-binding SARP family transcriptional activator/TolB-like protein